MANRITGHDAIEHARQTGAALSKYADPTEGERTGLTIEDAEAIASEDPSLVYCDSDLARCNTCGGWRPLHADSDRWDDYLTADGYCPGTLAVDETGQVVGCGAWDAKVYALERD